MAPTAVASTTVSPPGRGGGTSGTLGGAVRTFRCEACRGVLTALIDQLLADPKLADQIVRAIQDRR